MKKLVTLIAGVVLTAALSTAAFGQAAGPANGGVQTPPQTAGQQKHAHAPIGKKILKELNLTPDQQKQIKDLVEKFQKQHQDATANGAKVNRKEAAAMHKQFLEDLQKILTPEQQQKLKDLMAKARENVKNKNGLGAPAGTAGAAGAAGGTKTGGGGGN